MHFRASSPPVQDTPCQQHFFGTPPEVSHGVDTSCLWHPCQRHIPRTLAFWTREGKATSCAISLRFCALLRIFELFSEAGVAPPPCWLPACRPMPASCLMHRAHSIAVAPGARHCGDLPLGASEARRADLEGPAGRSSPPPEVSTCRVLLLLATLLGAAPTPPPPRRPPKPPPRGHRGCSEMVGEACSLREAKTLPLPGALGRVLSG